jgi:hypothetical protein
MRVSSGYMREICVADRHCNSSRTMVGDMVKVLIGLCLG